MKFYRNTYALIGNRQMPEDIEAIATLALLFVLNVLFGLALVIT